METNDRILDAGPALDHLVGATIVEFASETLVRLRKLDGEYTALPVAAIRSYTDPTNWVRRVAEAGSPEAAAWVARGFSPEVARKRAVA